MLIDLDESAVVESGLLKAACLAASTGAELQ